LATQCSPGGNHQVTLPIPDLEGPVEVRARVLCAASPSKGEPCVRGQTAAVKRVRSDQIIMVDLLHRHVGHITLVAGTPSWVFMDLAGVPYDGRVTCELRGAAGTIVMQGTFHLHDGSAVWARPLTIAPSRVKSARMVAPSGLVLASTHLIFDKP
jgi:hypothetical protein